MSNRILSNEGNINPHRQMTKINRVFKLVSHKARLSREFDSRKDSHPTKLERRSQILVKLSFRKFRDSKLSGLLVFDNMAIS